MDLAPEAKLRGAPGAGTGGRSRLAGDVPAASFARVALACGAAAAVAAGLVLRFVAPADLWLDEALAVNIARLSLAELPDALRHDGAPPLYYALLHGWMRLFGDGAVAVRAMSGVFAVAALPLAWAAGRRLGGPVVGWSGLLLLASSPFAVRYATEARMYALVILLVLAGHLVLARALERPSPARLAAVSAAAGLLLLTHYWALFLAGTVGLALLAAARRPGGQARAARRCLVALAAGFAALVPWAGVLSYQLRRTGTPWSSRPGFVEVADTVTQFAGGRTDAGAVLALVYVALLLLALLGRAVDGRRIELDLGGRAPAVGLGFVTLVTLLAAFAVTQVTESAFASRYASVVLAPFVLLVALGVRPLAAGRVRHGVVAVAVVLGLAAAAAAADAPRTQGGEVARAVARLAVPGDVVAYCPDQLGPAVSRVLPAGVDQVTFPDGLAPGRVDWVDYERRNRAGDPRAFARRLLARAGPAHAVFLVWAPGYRTLGTRCERLLTALAAERRGVTRVRREPATNEPMTLVQFAAP